MRGQGVANERERRVGRRAEETCSWSWSCGKSRCCWSVKIITPFFGQAARSREERGSLVEKLDRGRVVFVLSGAGPWSKLTSLSTLIGRGSHGSALSGWGLGQAPVRPAHSTRVDSSRKSWSAWRSRIGTVTAKILSRKNEPPETTGGPWYVVASEPKAASAWVPWIAMEDGI